MASERLNHLLGGSVAPTCPSSTAPGIHVADA